MYSKAFRVQLLFLATFYFDSLIFRLILHNYFRYF